MEIFEQTPKNDKINKNTHAKVIFKCNSHRYGKREKYR